ncbi:MAG: bifunctional nicotinamidase/pyrazinamidase [Bacteroidetes bacterium]|nr:bifunctional nicotinamidase/pyrazinamidase [Bacteroidota bacterium]MDA1269135.1 bifunctional nicotinamidase/pyrazinamidase [Bacteroidota bacterium]
MRTDTALLLVDVQNDFLPGGALAVPQGDEILPVIASLQSQFEHLVATQDYHPVDHGSFAANHSGKNPGEWIELEGLPQILWPTHCVEGTFGADFPSTLDRSAWKAVFQKGRNPSVDSYSGFFDNARRGDTGLGEYLKNKGIARVFVCGLALDYCVKFTALDANSLGFETYVFTDATRAVNLHSKDGMRALEEFRAAGIICLESKELRSYV